jgi:hypothetical protein
MVLLPALADLSRPPASRQAEGFSQIPQFEGLKWYLPKAYQTAIEYFRNLGENQIKQMCSLQARTPT